jgi:hypothetical protein
MAMDLVFVFGVVFGVAVAIRVFVAAGSGRVAGTFVASLDYIIATFLFSVMPLALAALLGLPLLAYGRYAHSETATRVFSMLLDRPFFPLQTIVAAFVGFTVGTRWHSRSLAWVWVPATINAASGFLFRNNGSAMLSFWEKLRENYFNWGCGCSASLLQWTFLAPMLAAVAASLAASLAMRYYRPSHRSRFPALV